MSVADKLGLGPTRKVTYMTATQSWQIDIQAPAAMKCPPYRIILNTDQYIRYKCWERGELMIQEALPELTADEREQLMSGINQKRWDEMFKESDE